MAYGNRAFRRVQIGKETTPGTAVAATAILFPDADGFSMEEPRQFHEPEEERNSLAMNRRSTLSGIGPVSMQFNGDALFEQIQYWFDGLIKQAVISQPDAVNSPTVYLWTWTPTFTALSNNRTYTLEFGDDVQAWEVEYSIVQSITLSGSPGQPVKISVTLVGRQMTDTTFTAALTPIAPEGMAANKTQLYVDSVFGDLGDTELAGSLIDFSVTLDSGIAVTKRLDGKNYFTKHGQNRRRFVTANMTLELNDDTNDYRALFAADTRRYFRLRNTGGVAEDAFLKTLDIDFAGKFRSWGSIGNQDGIDTVAITINSQYDVANSFEGSVALQNTVSALV